MDTSITVALIGIFGTCAIGGFGFIFTTLRAGIRDNSTRIGGLEERVGGLAVSFGRFEERTISEFGHVKDVLARIEATQEDHSRMLKDHGRVLEGHGRLLEGHGRLLEGHGRLLEAHSHQLADHGRLLEKLAGDSAS